ncbi:SsgA family sporulation/cell division regulator [Amycolatopsis sp. NPDC051061]|uniref:SsgA family sporulation/cell division regulator n=1 Tax=Amycolatopsis sp. NPDC051061 TaxID=3155042 RepID=UPI0034180AED
MDVDLRYDTTDPFAVTLSFGHLIGVWSDWALSRELLFEGMAAPAGEGDVRIRPSVLDPDLVLLHLESPSVHADFSADRRQLGEFLDCSADLVPCGREAERMDIDAVIAQVLGGNP